MPFARNNLANAISVSLFPLPGSRVGRDAAPIRCGIRDTTSDRFRFRFRRSSCRPTFPLPPPSGPVLLPPACRRSASQSTERPVETQAVAKPAPLRHKIELAVRLQKHALGFVHP